MYIETWSKILHTTHDFFLLVNIQKDVSFHQFWGVESILKIQTILFHWKPRNFLLSVNKKSDWVISSLKWTFLIKFTVISNTCRIHSEKKTAARKLKIILLFFLQINPKWFYIFFNFSSKAILLTICFVLVIVTCFLYLSHAFSMEAVLLPRGPTLVLGRQRKVTLFLYKAQIYTWYINR